MLTEKDFFLDFFFRFFLLDELKNLLNLLEQNFEMLNI